MRIAWDLNIQRAWCMSWTGSTGGGAITIERSLGDRLGLCLKGTVLAEGVVLVGDPIIKKDDDDDPLTTLFYGFDWIPPVEWLDKKTGEKVPTVVMSGEDDPPHDLEVQGAGPISDDPIAWVLAVRALFADQIYQKPADGKYRLDEMTVPSIDVAQEIRQAFLDYAVARPETARDYLLLQDFLAAYPKSLKP